MSCPYNQNDRVYVDDFYGDVNVSTGAGRDRIVVKDGTGNVNIDAGSGSDRVYVDDIVGNVDVDAGSGNDRVYVDDVDGDVSIDAGSGRDKVYVDDVDGNVDVDAGAGRDRIIVDDVDGDVSIDAGSGNDVVYIGDVSGSAAVDGGSGHDFLIGGNSDDEIHGGSGNDFIYGGRGDDMLFGDSGHDTLLGGKDNDTIEGGEGYDYINGGSGHDVAVYSGNRADYNITLGWWGKYRVEDTVSGRDGVDWVRNIEVFRFADGDINVTDILIVSLFTNNADTFNFNVDPIAASVDPNSYYNALAGDDAVVLADAATVVQGGYDESNVFDAGAGNDMVTGGDRNDIISDTQGVNQLDGGAGNDVVRSIGTDQSEGSLATLSMLRGGNNDVLASADEEADALSAGDTLDYSLRNVSNIDDDGVFVSLDGSQQVRTFSQAFPGDEIDNIDGFEHVIGSNANDSLRGDAGANVLIGNNGNDELLGEAGDDYLDGGSGNDTLGGFTEVGNDTHRGGSGNDNLIDLLGVNDVDGGSGNDRVSSVGTDQSDATAFASGELSILRGGTNDALVSASSIFDAFQAGDILEYSSRNISSADDDGVFVSLAGSQQARTFSQAFPGDEIDDIDGFEHVIGSNVNDSLRGDAGANVLIGNNGNDELLGEAGDDYLDGGSGNDTLGSFTEGGNDTHRGGSGNDNLIDWLGVNDVDGGSGNDRVSTVGTDQSDASEFASGELSMLRGGTNDALVSADSFLDAFQAGDILDYSGRAITNPFTDGVNVNLNGSQTAGTDFVANIDDIDGFEHVFGSNGFDELFGDSGANVLIGNGGDDRLSGGAGDDYLDGGLGGDDLTGGAGADIFVKRTNSGFDGINDFEEGIDKIDISSYGFSDISDFDFIGLLGNGVVIDFGEVGGGTTSLFIGSSNILTVADVDNSYFIF